MTSRPVSLEPQTQSPAQKRYDPPCVAWEEDFEPAGQTTGCADVGDNCPERPET